MKIRHYIQRSMFITLTSWGRFLGEDVDIKKITRKCYDEELRWEVN